jgi:ABC-2 type transport system permease protein
LRYLRLIKAIARYQLTRELEFPSNFVVATSIHLFFILVNLAFFSLIWFRVGGFGGLTPYQMLFFIGTYHLADSIYVIFTFFGIMEIPDLVRKGDMDFILTKPVPSQFMTTFRRFSWFGLTDMALGLTMIIYAVVKIPLHFSWYNLLFFVVMVVTGAAISYAMSCLVMTLSFMLIAVDAVWATFFEIAEFERYPMSVYPPPWRTVFSVTLPMIMVANFPAFFGLGKLSPWQLVWFFLAGALLIYGSHRFWEFGLKRYQSASS